MKPTKLLSMASIAMLCLTSCEPETPTPTTPTPSGSGGPSVPALTVDSTTLVGTWELMALSQTDGTGATVSITDMSMPSSRQFRKYTMNMHPSYPQAYTYDSWQLYFTSSTDTTQFPWRVNKCSGNQFLASVTVMEASGFNLRVITTDSIILSEFSCSTPGNKAGHHYHYARR
jgi:hypothetical protein